MTSEVILIRLGNNLRKIRKERKLTIEQLSFMTAVNKSYLSDLERGERNPTVVLLERIAIALNIDASELIKDHSKI